ncbi:MAG: hypothetical protein ABFS19_13715 [Thermodesulfobacteriota bacterium]
MKKTIRTLFVSSALLASFTVFATASSAESIVWSDTFTNGLEPTVEQCQAWHTFLSQLSPDEQYSSVTVKGTFNTSGITMTDPAAIQQLVQNISNKSTGLVESDGHKWSVFIGCNLSSCVDAGAGVQLAVDLDLPSGDLAKDGCSCLSSASTIRPDMGHASWGGISTKTCGASSQTMTVEFVIGSVETEGPVATDDCTSNEYIQACADDAKNHGQFVRCVSNTLNRLKKEGAITGKEKGELQECAAQADLP